MVVVEEHAEEDAKKKDGVEAKNIAETLINTTEKSMNEAKDKISEEDYKDITEKLVALKDVKDGDDTQAIKTASEELSKAAQKIGEAMYQNTPGADQAQAGQEGKAEEAKKEEVVEGEVEDVKEEKK